MGMLVQTNADHWQKKGTSNIMFEWWNNEITRLNDKNKVDSFWHFNVVFSTVCEPEALYKQYL